MKVTMICEGSLPTSTGGGPRLNQWAITDELRMRGHQVQVVYICPSQNFDGYAYYCLGSRGVRIDPVAFEQASPYTISSVIGDFKPDVITGLGTYNIAWGSAYDNQVPRVVIVGDPEHLVQGYRRQLKNREPMTYEEIAQIHNQGMRTKDVYLETMSRCQYRFCTAAHSAEWFRQQGLQCEYLPMPIPDTAFMGWRRREEDMPRNEKPRILLAGHLQGIATLSGLWYLVDEVLPNMPDYADYDWNVCGGEELLPSLAKRFEAYPEIKFRGFVPDIRKEILQADVFLCPTSSTCGVRTRLVEVMALGGCIVAHNANGIGQPEFKHNRNILLAGNGDEIAKHIDRLSVLYQDRYDIGREARQTFEDHFRTELSAGRVIDKMVEVCSR